MKNLKDQRTKIFPSTTRGGKELPSSSSLDSPSVLSKLATPKPASAINPDMSHVIDDATSAMHDTIGRMKLLKLIIMKIVIMKVLPIIMKCLRVRFWKKELL